LKKKATDATISAAKMPEFPNLNQRELAAFLGIDPKRLERATHAGIVMREGSLYPLAAATAQWLAYERSQNSRSKRRSALEREKAAFTKARRELAQLRLATLRGEMVNVNETAGALKAVCLRIRSRLQAALPRISRACYYAPSMEEAAKKVRTEFDLLMAELSAIDKDALMSGTPFEVVRNDNGEAGTSP
jgi:hypothetical protein